MQIIRILWALPLIAGCGSVPHIQTVPIPELSAQDAAAIEFSIADTLDANTAKARRLIRQFESLQASLLKQEDHTGLFQMLMAIGGAGAAAAQLHPDALIGFGAAAAIPALFTARYRPKDQRLLAQKGEDAVRCQVNHAERLQRGLASRTNESLAKVLVEQVDVGAPDAVKIFVDSVESVRSKVTRKQRDLITDTSYGSNRDKLVQQIIDDRKKAEELRKKAVPQTRMNTLNIQLADQNSAEERAKETAEQLVLFQTNLDKCAADQQL